jgi:similar to stage IV sporulation protein
MNKKIIVFLECRDIYEVLNIFQQCKINVYKVKGKKDGFEITIDYENAEKIKKYFGGYHPRIVDYQGFSKFKKIMINNKIFILICILGITVFGILNNLIVEIDVIHENKEIRELVQNALKENGIQIFKFKKSYKSLYQIRENILNAYPDKLDWLEIEEHGMKYIVKVEERIISKPSQEKDYCNVYALKDGLVTNIKITSGTPMIKVGDYVRKGDLLISGDIVLNEENKGQVCAKGEVFAKKWYSVDIHLPLDYQEYETTGRKKYNFVYQKNNYEKRLFRDRFKNYNYERKKIISLFTMNLYLEKEEETKVKKMVYNIDDALNKALLMGEEKIKITLKDKETIDDKKVLKKVVNDSTMDVELFIVTNEIISN